MNQPKEIKKQPTSNSSLALFTLVILAVGIFVYQRRITQERIKHALYPTLRGDAAIAARSNAFKGAPSQRASQPAPRDPKK